MPGNQTLGFGLQRLAQPCPYFRDGRDMELLYVSPPFPGAGWSELLPLGFRRSGGYYYIADCPACRGCVPIRLKCADFRPSKSGRRTLRRNVDLRVESAPSEPTEEKWLLYRDYLREVHGDDEAGMESFLDIHGGYPGIHEVRLYLGEKLIGVSVLDETDDGLSAVYFYHDPAERKRRPGVFSVMKDIEYASRLGKRYYYLGYWIKEIPAMSYKSDFRPCEILQDGVWRSL